MYQLVIPFSGIPVRTLDGLVTPFDLSCRGGKSCWKTSNTP